VQEVDENGHAVFCVYLQILLSKKEAYSAFEANKLCWGRPEAPVRDVYRDEEDGDEEEDDGEFDCNAGRIKTGGAKKRKAPTAGHVALAVNLSSVPELVTDSRNMLTRAIWWQGAYFLWAGVSRSCSVGSGTRVLSLAMLGTVRRLYQGTPFASSTTVTTAPFPVLFHQQVLQCTAVLKQMEILKITR